MAIDFGKLDVSELEMFLVSVKGTDLETKIIKELDRRKELSKYAIQEEFMSSRLPDFNIENLYRAKQLALEFDVMRLPSMWTSACLDSNNNSKGDFYVGLFGSDKGSLAQKWMHNLGYLSLLFQDDTLRRNYEGTYNTVNYMINGIYRSLNSDDMIEDVEQLFSNVSLKQSIVRENFSDVVEYLWDIRSSVLDSRSSIGNHGLTMNRGKTRKRLTVSQKALIESVAFGCSLKELEKGNYEGAKRLIYVPENKIRR